ncbi:hypothetical protein [Agrococcus beijingensis]|uniref:hypothetical protein n=1 Tax=Agrococcus beijingensis TaxID=3068634 RepID=UPI0027417991|nr:hypothetical protein [Agrococcus sp. REN33]
MPEDPAAIPVDAQIMLEVLQIVAPLAAVLLAAWVGAFFTRKSAAAEHQRATDRDEAAARRQAEADKSAASSAAAEAALERVDALWNPVRDTHPTSSSGTLALDPELYHAAGRAVAKIRDTEVREPVRDALYGVFHAWRAIAEGTWSSDAWPYVRQRQVMEGGINVLQAHMRGDPLPGQPLTVIRHLLCDVKRAEKARDQEYEAEEAAERASAQAQAAAVAEARRDTTAPREPEAAATALTREGKGT